jgi:hypothetical protein
MGNGVTNILLIEGTKVAQQKTRLYADRWKNEEGKHKIQFSLNKDPLSLMNQQILEYKQCLMGKIQQILCCLGIHKSLVAFDPQINNIFK